LGNLNHPSSALRAPSPLRGEGTTGISLLPSGEKVPRDNRYFPSPLRGEGARQGG